MTRGYMDTILEQITKKIRLEEKEGFTSFSMNDALLVEREKPIDFIEVAAKEFVVIAECKKGSPSKGIFHTDYNPQTIAKAYQRGGASAISVITEKHFFFGHLTHLSQVKEVVSLPVLRKDFLLHPSQIIFSYNLGADFVLLIAACLSDQELKELYHLALSLGMQVLVEVHNQEELERVLQIKPQVIGINNRDLKTFKVDLETSFRLKKLIPKDILVISESGIGSFDDITRLKQAGFAGVLVGEWLLRQSNPEEGLKRLLHG